MFLAPQNLFASTHHGSDHQQIFHAFTLQADIGHDYDGAAKSIDFSGWIGGDYNRLWLKNETKYFGKYDSKNESQALYSRNISQFWDVQIGVRHDVKTDFSSHSVDYLAFGLEGLAPYLFETEIRGFVSNEGNYSAHLKQEIDIFITQKLITQPYFEADIFAQNVEKLKVMSGLAEFEIGALTRYEITRKFAPYLALRYNRKTFATADLAKKSGDRIGDFIAGAGLRLRF